VIFESFNIFSRFYIVFSCVWAAGFTMLLAAVGLWFHLCCEIRVATFGRWVWQWYIRCSAVWGSDQ